MVGINHGNGYIRAKVVLLGHADDHGANRRQHLFLDVRGEVLDAAAKGRDG